MRHREYPDIYSRIIMTLIEMVQICLQENLNGEKTDKCIISMAGNILKEENPFISIRLDNKAYLLEMMKKADHTLIFIENSIFYISAIYNYTPTFPASRIYFIRTDNLMNVASLGTYFNSQSIELPPIDGQALSKIINDNEYSERYKKWKEFRDKNDKIFHDLLDGRLNNTRVEQGIWLSSNNNCVICNKHTNRMSTATVLGKDGIMLGMQLCEEHEDEAKNRSNLINFLAEKCGIPPLFTQDSEILNHNEINLIMAIETLKVDLECEIEKIDLSKYTVTAKRESGYKIIVRQESLDNYAYMIIDSRGKEVSRIDSANHHNINYGPAHIHHDLHKSKKNIVETSFTYGSTILDIKSIKKLIEKAENKK